MKHARVSVIIPAYRAASTIRRAVDSVLAQTTAAYEIIVVDDGSPDDLADIVERYPSPVKLLRIANAKTAQARNVGIENAEGDFVAFLDADDHWHPQKLEKQLAVFARHPEVGAVAGRFYHRELSGRIQESRVRPKWNDHVLVASGSAAFLLGTMMWTGVVMVRRETLGEQRFIAGLEPAEDRDLWIRLAARSAVYLMSEPLATAVLETDGISRISISRDCRKMLEVVERHRGLLSPLARRRWLSYIYYRWGAIELLPGKALALMLRSFAHWPAPLLGLPAMESCGRLRRTLALCKQLPEIVSARKASGGAV